ncbi:MAG: sulfatase-like hydrolase/transferase [Pirellulaceae bacterium]|nr:sulfatase-like hydrolase/transferase [Pirellulaceae bacterium]
MACAADRPNILWITSEDNSPYLGCYGDPQAQTPHLDRLAAEGVRYRNAFANAPVCSTARTTLITGMYACSLGAQHHRSRVPIPDSFPLYPVPLREAGYYCTNNSKTDYNVANVGKPWDESSPRAHYKNRRPGQPFFAIFNLTTSHESQVAPKAGKDPSSYRVPPEKIVLPPYHPDTPEIRLDWANYYAQVTRLDEQVGALLSELEEAGLAEDTIVFYYSDHGGALPRGKRNLHDSGTHVPLIIRFPQKWTQLAPAQPGQWSDQLVSFVDFPATLLSLGGVPIPKNYQGCAFLGDQKAAPREHVFLFRGRMDERYDTVRAVRDSQFRYIRNYSPHRPWGQHYSYPFQVLPSMRSWYAAFVAGQCNPVQARYWEPKPSEELYDVAADPFEIQNLAGDPGHAERLAKMRSELRAEMIATRDTGFIPEGMFARLAGDKTIYDYAQSDAYPIERIVALADKASSRDPADLPDLTAAMEDPHPIIRYWGAVGCLVLQDKAAGAKAALTTLLNDDWGDVRVAAAEAVSHLGESEAALDTLAAVLDSPVEYEILAALNALDFLWAADKVPLERIHKILQGRKFGETPERIAKYLLSQTVAKRPNVLFFLADDLGQRDLGCYGSAFYETPNLDGLARDGARFTDAYAACPVCSPTRASIMTGRWPQRTGITDYIGAAAPDKWGRNTKLLPAAYSDRLALEEITLAEALKGAGYATFFAGKWHLGPEGFWPENQGFDINKGGIDRGGPYGGNKYFSPYGNPRLEDGPPGEHLPDRLATETAKFIEANRARPFFAYLAFYSVHTPLMAREDLKQKYEEKRQRLGLKAQWGREGERDVRLVQEHAVYAGMVEAMDLAVGKVLAKLDELGLRDNTLVVFTSDNGGLSTSEGWPTSNLPLRGGKGWLYEGGVREPLLVRWPRVVKAGAVIGTPVSSPDFFPTLLEAAGAQRKPGQQLDGVSLLPVLAGQAQPPERSLGWHYPHYGNQGGAPGAAIRRGDWKLIEWFEDDRVELYDLARDISETTDLAAKEPERVKLLRAELHAWQQDVAAKLPASNPGYDASRPSGRGAKRPPDGPAAKRKP